MDALPGAKTPIPLDQVENLAAWSSTIESSRGWIDDARRRHCWNDSRHLFAAAPTVVLFSSKVSLMSAMANSWSMTSQ